MSPLAKQRLAWSLLAATAIGCFATNAWAQFAATVTNDWDASISSSFQYSHAINLGGEGVTVNGVTFDRYNTLGSNAIDGQSGLGYRLTSPGGTVFDSLTPWPTNVVGQSIDLTPGFAWGGGSGTGYSIQLDGLTEGQPYQLSLYQAAWNDPAVPSREAALSVNGVTVGAFDPQSAGVQADGSRNGGIVTFGYTPSTSSVVFDLQMTGAAVSTPHLQAFSNHRVAAADPLPELEIPTFQDVTAAVGLSAYRATSGDLHSPGGVFTDLDNDGYPDLYLVRNDSTAGKFNQLYLNRDSGNGARVFELQANALGAENATQGTPTNYVGVTGAIAADYDNDGDQDLYVTNMGGTNRLYQSQLTQTGSLGFVDVTDQAGVSGLTESGQNSGSQHSLTAAWADPDRDGDLDLYVGSHDKWRTAFNGERDTFYLNNGDGTFTDATNTTPGDPLSGFLTASGSVSGGGQTHSATNAVIFADFDNDQWPDLLVTNKTNRSADRSMLYINQGDDEQGGWQGFRTATYQPELAESFGLVHWAESAMGVDVKDIDNDGDMDIFITDNPGQGPNGNNDVLINQIVETGVLSFDRRENNTGLSWGIQLEDFDNDGHVEAHVTNDTDANAGKSALLVFDDPASPSTSPLTDVAALAGVENQGGNDRGNLAADFNRDGKLDLFVVNLNNDPRFAPADLPSSLYENTTDNDSRFLSVKLVGDPSTPTTEGLATSRDAIGSRVILIVDTDQDGLRETLVREVVSGSSNAASSSSLELEFGLGQADEAIAIVYWADGRITTLGHVSADQFLTVDQAIPILPGDYNNDGVVGPADYTVWRDAMGQVAGSLPNDTSGVDIGEAQYIVWRNHYGESIKATASTVPEPQCWAAVVAAASWIAIRRQRVRPEGMRSRRRSAEARCRGGGVFVG